MPGIATNCLTVGLRDLEWSLSPEQDISFCSFRLCSFRLISRGGEKYAKNWTLSRMAWAEGPWVLRSFNSLRALLFLRQKKKMAVVASGTKFREVSKIFFCIWKNIDKFAIINLFFNHTFVSALETFIRGVRINNWFIRQRAFIEI